MGEEGGASRAPIGPVAAMAAETRRAARTISPT
jgi:hypothetical protein